MIAQSTGGNNSQMKQHCCSNLDFIPQTPAWTTVSAAEQPNGDATGCWQAMMLVQRQAKASQTIPQHLLTNACSNWIRSPRPSTKQLLSSRSQNGYTNLPSSKFYAVLRGCQVLLSTNKQNPQVSSCLSTVYRLYPTKYQKSFEKATFAPGLHQV